MTATSQEIIQSSQWHHLSIQEVTRHLDTNLETGLTSAVAAKNENVLVRTNSKANLEQVHY